MNRNNYNLRFEDSDEPLDSNISRLVNLAKDTNKPSRAFIESLIDSAISELKRLEVQRRHRRKSVIARIGWLEKTIGWAAMVAAACGAGLIIVVSTLLKMNSLLAAIVILTMFVNWLNYLGGLIL